MLTIKLLALIVLIGVLAAESARESTSTTEPAYSNIKPQIIRLDVPPEDNRAGGLIAADLDNSGVKEFIITKPGHVAVYTQSGDKLWSKTVDIQVTGRAERTGLPGLHAPGVQVVDVDRNGRNEVLYLTKDGALHIVDSATGKEKWTIALEAPEGTERWEHLVVANFRGKGDRDLLLQATNAKGYRMGRYLAAYALEDLIAGNLEPLWQRNDFVPTAHTGARVADLNGDGRDAVLGAMVIGPNGEVLSQVRLKGRHLDAIIVGDIDPDIPGVQVVATEEGGGRRILPHRNGAFRTINYFANRIFPDGNRVFLYNHEGPIWKNNHKHLECQNAAIGNFDPARPGLEIWCRSRNETHQSPWVFDSQGRVIASYQMSDVAPRGWTIKGVEVIWTIDWTGHEKQLIAVKERHTSGDVAIIDPMTGRFLHRFKEKADRLYVADVSGDWREEIIVLNGNELRIYENSEPNPNPNRPRLWEENHHYRRSKMTWNYYSP